MDTNSSTSEVSSQVSQTTQSHYNAVPNRGIQERSQSKIFHLRNFNNWMKSMLISDFIERLRKENCQHATVLDLCCGKGGDLLKWKIGNIKEIVMTDVADVALNHCKNRYEEMRERFTRDRKTPFAAHFIHADATQDNLREKYPDKHMRFDLVSCQFALHYSFSSEQSARRLLFNAADALRPGGYFIGTLPDANAIVKYLRMGSDGVFKNDVVQITYKGENISSEDHPPPLFGAQLLFELDEVVNCPEYLAYLPLVVRILEEFGMELVYHHSFPDAVQHYLKTNMREAKPLMNRMRALEVFPPLPNTNLIGDPSEYLHAEEKLKELSAEDPNARIGTMSKSEWEVVSMYLVFAFRKK